jgi:hypothetical protein
MREKRNDLRPVLISWNGENVKGYFHCFCQVGNVEEGIEQYALVELEDGTVIQPFAHGIKFEDVK